MRGNATANTKEKGRASLLEHLPAPIRTVHAVPMGSRGSIETPRSSPEKKGVMRGKIDVMKKDPHAPTYQKRSGGRSACVLEFPLKKLTEWLSLPDASTTSRVFLQVLFGKIAEDRVIVGAGPEMSSASTLQFWGVVSMSCLFSFQFGKPFHKFIRDRRASRTSRIPAPVIRKYVCPAATFGSGVAET
jgi:hypothetical protein